ncbi:hypothetical protein [Arthrobacter sp.]|uniref:hypothetical protein n=1 Tax=Arthrobacter sp. TaxID=1667 RepID=UPI0025831BAE|nr:hypothetical protein [Arthrobacter sp.]
MLAHLRELRKIGFTVSSGDEKKPRQLIWSAVPGGVRLGAYSRTEDYAVEADSWLKVQLIAQAQIFQDWVTLADNWPEDWRSAAEMYNGLLHMSADDLEELARDLRELMDKWHDRRSRPVPDTRPVYVSAHAVPYPHDYTE